MPERNLILHIGAPKAGSSALQSFFALNAEAMKRQGIFYPPFNTDQAAREGKPTNGNGHDLGRALEHDPRPGAREMLRTRLSHPSPNIFLSCEYFWAIKQLGADLLAEEAERAAREIRILAYLRPQPDWLFSGYAHRLRHHGETRGIREFYLRQREKMIPQVALQFMLRFKPKVRLYRSTGLCDDAAAFLGIGGEDLIYPPVRVNAGMSIGEASAMRERNAATAGVQIDNSPAFVTPEHYAEMEEFYRPHNEAFDQHIDGQLRIPQPR